MAKSENPSFFELHVEKIALAACILAVVAVAYLVFGTDPSVEIYSGPAGQREVAYEKVGPTLDAAAADLKKRIEDQEPEGGRAWDYAKIFDRYAEEPFPEALTQVTPFARGQKLIRYEVTEIPPADLDVLARLMPSSLTPQVQARWMVPLKDPRVMGDGQRGRGPRGGLGNVVLQAPLLQEFGVAVCVSQFDLAQLKEAWADALRDTAVEPVFVVYDQENEIQVFENGQWVTIAREFTTVRPGQNEALSPLFHAPPDEGRGGGFGDFGGFDRGGRRMDREEGPVEIPAFDGENAQEVWQAVQDRRTWMEYFLHPNWHYYFHFPTRHWVPWQTMVTQTPLIRDFYTFLKEEKRKRLMEGLPIGAVPPPLDEIQLDRPMVARDAEGNAFLDVPYPVVEVVLPAEDPQQLGDDGGRGFDGRPPFDRDDRRFERRRERRDDREDGMRPGLTRARLEQLELPAHVTYLPPTQWQLQQGKLLYWFFFDKMEPNKRYRVRSRLRFVNPLLAKPRDTKTPAQASKIFVDSQSAWSQWSEPFSLPENFAFYLTGSSRTSETLQITVFRKQFDQWLAEPFEVAAGQRIGTEKSSAIFNPMTGRSELRPIDFSTDATSVSLSFDRISPQSLSASALDRTDELIYLDPVGQLERRLRSRDDASREKIRLMSMSLLQKRLVQQAAQLP
jgi:hypothetical protein